jgi:hypothetical protein
MIPLGGQQDGGRLLTHDTAPRSWWFQLKIRMFVSPMMAWKKVPFSAASAMENSTRVMYFRSLTRPTPSSHEQSLLLLRNGDDQGVV